MRRSTKSLGREGRNHRLLEAEAILAPCATRAKQPSTHDIDLVNDLRSPGIDEVAFVCHDSETHCHRSRIVAFHKKESHRTRRNYNQATSDCFLEEQKGFLPLHSCHRHYKMVESVVVCGVSDRQGPWRAAFQRKRLGMQLWHRFDPTQNCLLTENYLLEALALPKMEERLIVDHRLEISCQLVFGGLVDVLWADRACLQTDSQCKTSVSSGWDCVENASAS